MIFIAGVFPAAIYMTTVSTEQSIAATAADEAFAKIKIYDVNFASPRWPANPTIECVDFIEVWKFAPMLIDPDEFFYPSTNVEKHYYWSALCRRVSPVITDQSVQVTVFVCRKIGSSLNWRLPDKVGVSKFSNNVLQIEAGKETWINDGYTIVDNTTGHIYRVLERDNNIQNRIVLDRQWQGNPTGIVWVVPAPAGGRYPCVAVYQKVIRFSL
jgi:hypothetical protein